MYFLIDAVMPEKSYSAWNHIAIFNFYLQVNADVTAACHQTARGGYLTSD